MPEGAQEKEEIKITVERGDPLIREAGLWLDPHRPRDFAFVSHAHADHFAPHQKILCSSGTRKIAEKRYRDTGSEFLSLDFGESVELETGYRATLYPAGHIPGSAMLLLERESDGVSLLHTGDFKTLPAPGAELCEPQPADTLIMETTFGIPKFTLPPSDEVIDAMVKFVRETIEEDQVPVFLAYSLGKAQEILLSLHQRIPEIPRLVHSSVAKMNEAVATLGYDIPACIELESSRSIPKGHLIVMPPNVARSRAIRRVRKSLRLAMISGWGMDSGARYRYQCDEVFPLSDHAGYRDLLDFVEKVAPKRVYTIHGYVDEFARDLRNRGYEAWPLREETQLEFALPGQPGIQQGMIDDPTGSKDQLNRVASKPESEFGNFVSVCEEITTSTGKLAKQKILAQYLRSLKPPTLEQAVTFLSGKPFTRNSEVRAANVGWAIVRQALLDVSGLSLAQYRQISSSQADAARTANLVLREKTEPQPHSIAEVAEAFAQLANQSGQTEKLRILRETLITFHHSEAALLVGILTGDLRIGLKDGLLESSIGEAFHQKGNDVRRAHMLTGDLGKTANLARSGSLEEADANWFTPLKVMLASPEETAEDIVARLGGENQPIWLEDKFDGIRAQLHRKGKEVELFSRDLRPIHEQFPEITESARNLERDVILDGEIIAYAAGKRLTFFDLQKRLGRKGLNTEQGDLFLGEAIPVRFIAFDLLGIDGKGKLDTPLQERRRFLDEIAMSGSIYRCNIAFARTAKQVDDAFNEARRRDNEGLIAKDPTSIYSPGRRGKQWLKLKKAMPTLDVVVVKAQQGHGKRSHVLSDYTFAVREEDSDELRIIGKAYSGLTDVDIEELTEHFQTRTIEKSRGIHIVEPDIILEIAFDSINPSKRHDSGLALRFPRIKAIRRDKTIDDIDTLAYAQKLAER